MITSTYKNDLKVCREWFPMVYRNGDDHQLPFEGSGMFFEVEGEDEKEGWSVWRQD